MPAKRPHAEHLVRVSTVGALVSLLALALGPGCAPSAETGPCTKTVNGSSCLEDRECCSGNCRWQGGGYCQDAKLAPPPCQAFAEGCTQGKHCCSGVCENGACLGTEPVVRPPIDPRDGSAGCKPPGDGCATDSECCAGGCSNGTCLGASGGGGGGGGGSNCGGTGATCRLPGDCCRRLCSGNRCK